MNFKAEFAHKTDTGKVRQNNEDNALVCEELGLAAVADGMGGHTAGELASAIAVKVLKERLESMVAGNIKPAQYDEKMSVATNRLAFAAQLANDVIFEASKSIPENRGMGTTLSAVLFTGDTVSTAHIGDSRIYRLREGNLEQLTQDHSLVMDQVRKGLITKQQAEKSSLQNILTRALGTQKTAAIDTAQHQVMENDRFFLCTDGLFKAVTEDEIKSVLSENQDNQAACDAMVKKANDAGGPDNVTVVIMEIKAKHWKDSMKHLLRRIYA